MVRAGPSGVLCGKAYLFLLKQLISSDFSECRGNLLAQLFYNVCRKIQKLRKHSSLWLEMWVTGITVIALLIVSLRVLQWLSIWISNLIRF